MNSKRRFKEKLKSINQIKIYLFNKTLKYWGPLNFTLNNI